MTANTNDFQKSLAYFAKRMGMNREKLVRYIALQMMSRVIKRTPVDTGRARSGWDMTLGTPSSFLPPDRTRMQNTGGLDEVGSTLGDLQDQTLGIFQGGVMLNRTAAAAQIDGTQNVFIINNVPYIIYLEDGWSKQSPAGMVRLTIAEMEAEIEIMARRLFAEENR